MKTKKVNCPKCKWGYIEGLMYGKEIKLAEHLSRDKGAIDYANEITGRKPCDYCFGTGEINQPVREPINLCVVNLKPMGE